MPPRPFPTHFLCLPLVSTSSRPQLSRALEAFAADVTSLASFGVPRDAIRPVGTLHLTLGVFAFPGGGGEALERATALLRGLKVRDLLGVPMQPNAAGPEEPSLDPPIVALRGLASTQEASRASMLYAPPVDQTGALQAFCERLRSVFQEAGLLLEDNRPLLLHATVLNTVYVKGERDNRQNRGKRRERLTIDARGILDRYEDQVWLENFKVEKVALCKMGAKKISVDGVEDEAYEVVAEIDL